MKEERRGDRGWLNFSSSLKQMPIFDLEVQGGPFHSIQRRLKAFECLLGPEVS